MSFEKTDKLYIEFVESLDMFIPGNDCSDYREQNDYQSMSFTLDKIKALEEKLKVAIQALQDIGYCKGKKCETECNEIAAKQALEVITKESE